MLFMIWIKSSGTLTLFVVTADCLTKSTWSFQYENLPTDWEIFLIRWRFS